MAKLILSMDGLVLKEIPLTKERTTIGRRPHNDIQIDNLAISGDHAAVVVSEGVACVEDLNSTNGTYVNGQAVEKQLLRNNDVIELGKYRMKYVQTASSAIREAPLVVAREATRSPVIEHASERPFDLDEDILTTQRIPRPGASLGLGVIEVVSGNQSGRKLELSKPDTTLGKPGVQVAVISRREQGYFIAGAEGPDPLINGKPVVVGTQQPLQHRDVIDIGGVKMAFYLRSA